MDEEEKKERYINIIKRLRIISDKIDNLENQLDNLKKLNNNTLNINGAGVGETNITNTNNYIDSSSNVINNTIIPNIEERDGVRVVKEKNKVWPHGKIYKREFLKKNNINFNNTRSNNRNYKISGLEGFCINMKWAIEESIKKGADKSNAQFLATSSLVSMYYDYLYTRDEPNNKDILKYSKILLPYYMDNEKVTHDFINHCIKYKENDFEQEKKEYIKDITFDDFINEVINNG